MAWNHTRELAINKIPTKSEMRICRWYVRPSFLSVELHPDWMSDHQENYNSQCINHDYDLAYLGGMSNMDLGVRVALAIWVQSLQPPGFIYLQQSVRPSHWTTCDPKLAWRNTSVMTSVQNSGAQPIQSFCSSAWRRETIIHFGKKILDEETLGWATMQKNSG